MLSWDNGRAYSIGLLGGRFHGETKRQLVFKFFFFFFMSLVFEFFLADKFGLHVEGIGKRGKASR